jgi:5-(carboxyamino)imidazole ribonucleotide synthase
MVNLLGDLPRVESMLAVPGAHFHDYGKSPRPGRKVGHCTLVDDDRERLLERLRQVERLIQTMPS